MSGSYEDVNEVAKRDINFHRTLMTEIKTKHPAVLSAPFEILVMVFAYPLDKCLNKCRKNKPFSPNKLQNPVQNIMCKKSKEYRGYLGVVDFKKKSSNDPQVSSEKKDWICTHCFAQNYATFAVTATQGHGVFKLFKANIKSDAFVADMEMLKDINPTLCANCMRPKQQTSSMHVTRSFISFYAFLVISWIFRIVIMLPIYIVFIVFAILVQCLVCPWWTYIRIFYFDPWALTDDIGLSLKDLKTKRSPDSFRINLNADGKGDPDAYNESGNRSHRKMTSTYSLFEEVEDIDIKSVAKVAEMNAIEDMLQVPALWGKMSLSNSENGIELSAKRGYCTAIGNMKLTKGKWYYEIVLQIPVCGQIGWGMHSQTITSAKGLGTGDDEKGWAYDGHRKLKWNKKRADYGEKWSKGDVIGCAINIDDKEMEFYLNGNSMGVAFRDFDVGEGLSPSITIQSGGQVEVIFQSAKFQKNPPNGYMAITRSMDGIMDEFGVAVELWCIGRNNVVWRSANGQGTDWEAIVGTLKGISVGMDGQILGLNAETNAVQKYIGDDTCETLTSLRSMQEISCGDGDNIYAINKKYKVYQLQYTDVRRWDKWESIHFDSKIKFVQISCGGGEEQIEIYGIDDKNNVYKCIKHEKRWKKLGISLTQISVGQDGSVFGVDNDKKLVRLSNGGKLESVKFGQDIARISAVRKDVLYVVTTKGEIYTYGTRLKEDWHKIEGCAKYISAAIISAKRVRKINISIGQIYAIKSISSQRYLDGRNPVHSNPLLAAREPKDDKYLHWKFEKIRKDIYAIKSVSGERYLDGRTEKNSNPLLTDGDAKTNECLQWILSSAGMNVAIQSVSSKKYLDGRNPDHSDPLLTERDPTHDKYLQWILIPMDDENDEKEIYLRNQLIEESEESVNEEVKINIDHDKKSIEVGNDDNKIEEEEQTTTAIELGEIKTVNKTENEYQETKQTDSEDDNEDDNEEDLDVNTPLKTNVND
eukprot:461328_1